MVSSHLFLQPRSAFREAGKVHGLYNEQTSQLIETLLQRVEGFFEEDKETGRQGDREQERHGDVETGRQGDKETGRQENVSLSVSPPLPVSLSSSLPVSLSPPLPFSPSPPPSFPLEPERWPRLLPDARRLLGRPRDLSVPPVGIGLPPDPIEN